MPERIRRHWEVEDLDFAGVDSVAFDDDWLAFKILATASFIEAGSDLYAGNLREFFAGDDEFERWLAGAWEPEELRHGAALRAYVERLWPAFDWPSRFRDFLADYGRTCTVPDLEATQALELAARCMVEMGTSALYRAIRDYAREPVLKRLASLIYADEVHHYKMFFRYFRRYQRGEALSRASVGRTLVKRLLATRGEDGRCAYRQVWDFAPAAQGESFDASYRAFSRDVTRLLRRYAPAEMMTRMILKPLSLPSPIVAIATRLSAPLYGLWFAAAR
jgi:hypothetical protein